MLLKIAKSQKLGRLFTSMRHNSSTNNSFIDLNINEKNGIATATLNRPPVNSLNLEFLTNLVDLFRNLGKNQCKGLILTSSSNRVFSAGLDLTELYNIDTSRFEKFWGNVQQLWIEFFGCTYPTVAVINGHAPAGGCLLATASEYRIMLPNFKIGFNEVPVGLPVPQWIYYSLANTISSRKTELALTSGTLFQTHEALKIGLIDEIVNTKEEGIERAELFLQRFSKIPRQARVMTKQMLRGAALQHVMQIRDEEVENMKKFLSQAGVQKSIELYLKNLKKK